MTSTFRPVLYAVLYAPASSFTSCCGYCGMCARDSPPAITLTRALTYYVCFVTTTTIKHRRAVERWRDGSSRIMLCQQPFATCLHCSGLPAAIACLLLLYCYTTNSSRVTGNTLPLLWRDGCMRIDRLSSRR